jgi:hypothetical protein
MLVIWVFKLACGIAKLRIVFDHGKVVKELRKNPNVKVVLVMKVKVIGVHEVIVFLEMAMDI